MTELHREAFDYIPNMRRLRAVIAVAEAGSVMRAAETLHLSQPAVTRAVRDLEKELGLALFERHRSGMLCTTAGKIVLHRFRRALQQLGDAEAALARMQPAGHSERLTQRLSHRQLTVLVAIADLHNEPQAAQRLGLTQPAVSGNLRDLENLLGVSLFLRTQRGMLATDCGALLIRYAKVALRELALVSDDLSAWQGEVRGRVVIGTLPLSSSLLVPQAVDALLRELPGLHVTILEGTYDALFESLRHGDIDILIGALRQAGTSEDTVQQRLFHDRLAVAVRRGHPLMQYASLSLSDLLDARWIAPRQGTPARVSFEQEFRSAGLAPPDVVVESGNLSTIRTLLLDSDRVTLVSPHQVFFEVQSGQLALLPIKLTGTLRPIGITTRVDDSPTHALKVLQRILLELGERMASPSLPSYA
ncbi:LysR family transcriptional regulator [Chromohalobacter nigrandesensis]|uniref:LysR family transcriptional regulator n=1 Tax=Chromohalobacter nigrandesensis TaxID=119863 RepID=UPI001FF1B420|nr:LysR family transcriptional regulator [Chromohalobacter nigrandesensis]MCK0745184.1 LysR family transcriptional regulator [Chromohalobacter nigrandesensis]